MEPGKHQPDNSLICSLADAISLLEKGDMPGALRVDLGDGQVAQFDATDTPNSVYQRLRGHRMLLAVAAGHVSIPARDKNDTPRLSPMLRSLLDVIDKAG